MVWSKDLVNIDILSKFSNKSYSKRGIGCHSGSVLPDVSKSRLGYLLAKGNLVPMELCLLPNTVLSINTKISI